jgi:Domain of unknown function (DUF5615)
MALLYGDENFDYPVVEHLRLLGHDVLTVQEAGKGGGDMTKYSQMPPPPAGPF